MKELFDAIDSTMVVFSHEMSENVRKGNKAAGVRARKISRELEKLLKEYRKRSIVAAKE